MKDVKKWIARASIALIAGLGALAAQAQGCDAAALTCFASEASAPAANASFLDLMQAGDEAPADYLVPRDALPQPAVYVPQTGVLTPGMAPAAIGALDAQLGESAAPGWLALPKSLAAPDSSIAWIFAIGFLGFVVLRRVRGANSY